MSDSNKAVTVVKKVISAVIGKNGAAEISVDDVAAEFNEKITKLENIKAREEGKITEADSIIKAAERVKLASASEAERAGKFAENIRDFCNV